jgi:hypothetical protein
MSALPTEMAESVRRRPSHDRVFPFGHVASLPPKGYRTVAGAVGMGGQVLRTNLSRAFASAGVEVRPDKTVVGTERYRLH